MAPEISSSRRASRTCQIRVTTKRGGILGSRPSEGFDGKSNQRHGRNAGGEPSGDFQVSALCCVPTSLFVRRVSPRKETQHAVPEPFGSVCSCAYIMNSRSMNIRPPVWLHADSRRPQCAQCDQQVLTCPNAHIAASNWTPKFMTPDRRGAAAEWFSIH